MAVHGVFISARNRDGTAVDLALRGVFAEVYRIGAEFWLVDSRLDAEDVAGVARARLAPEDKVFVAALARDVWSGLSPHARAWLVAPGRTWEGRDVGRGAGACVAAVELALAEAA